MLGKLNYEVMSLSWLNDDREEFGNKALDDTSWQNAEYHGQGAEIWPT